MELPGANGQNLAVVEDRHRVVDETERRAGIALANDSASLSVARSFVASVLESWDREDPDNIVPLLTSEIVSNAVRHAAGRVVLELALSTRKSSAWRCGTVHPRRRSSGGRILAASVGMGSPSSSRLARSWGVERYEDHKVVWFEAPVSPRRPASPRPSSRLTPVARPATEG